MKKLTAIVLIICMLFAFASCKGETETTEPTDEEVMTIIADEMKKKGTLFAEFRIAEKIVGGENSDDYRSEYYIDGSRIYVSIGQVIDVSKPITVTGVITSFHDVELQGQEGSGTLELDENGEGSVTFQYSCEHDGQTTDFEVMVNIFPYMEYYEKVAKYGLAD